MTKSFKTQCIKNITKQYATSKIRHPAVLPITHA